MQIGSSLFEYGSQMYFSSLNNVTFLLWKTFIKEGRLV